MSEQIKFCPQCGKELPDIPVKFCPFCGEVLPTINSVPPEENSFPEKVDSSTIGIQESQDDVSVSKTETLNSDQNSSDGDFKILPKFLFSLIFLVIVLLACGYCYAILEKGMLGFYRPIDFSVALGTAIFLAPITLASFKHKIFAILATIWAVFTAMAFSTSVYIHFFAEKIVWGQTIAGGILVILLLAIAIFIIRIVMSAIWDWEKEEVINLQQTNSVPEMVKIPEQDFSIGKFPITRQEYFDVMGKDPAFFKSSPNLPVEIVSWNDAMEFCEQLTARERQMGRLPNGYKYCLPTSEQWEFACRAGTTTKFYSGDSEDDLARVAWYRGNSENKTHPVGQKEPNSFGLYDMHGNVWEWCLDSSGFDRLCHGGSWRDNIDHCVFSKIYTDFPHTRYSFLGFRVALVPERKEESRENWKAAFKLLGTIVFVCFLLILAISSCSKGNENVEKSVPEKEVALEKNYLDFVQIPGKNFAICKYEVTQKLYKEIMGINPSNFLGDNLPVEKVSWNDAMKFCKQLTAREREAGRLPNDKKYTLPTVEQWQYACRAGTTTRFYSGDSETDLSRVAWYSGNANNKSHPVGEKEPNAFGLYDMHGNVWEWCLDKENDKYANVGGGCASDSSRCESQNVDYGAPHEIYGDLGFRVVLVPVK